MDQFWQRVRIEGSCWVWLGSVKGGIPNFTAWERTGKRQTSAVRWAWQHLAHKRLQWSDKLRPTCGCPLCVNPAHARLWTHREHLFALGAKGLLGGKGDRNGMRRHPRHLTPEKLAYVLASKESSEVIAKAFGCAASTIRHARTGRTWKDADIFHYESTAENRGPCAGKDSASLAR